GIVEPRQLGEAWRREIGAGAKLVVRRGAGEAVPRADREAIVAAIDPVAHQRAQLVRDRAVVLDGEIGDAARRIEPIGCREGVRRADLLTPGTTAAAVGVRRVGCDVERGVDLAEEQPGAVRARDEVGVLALPAQPGALGEGLFHHRRGVHEHLYLFTAARGDELGEVLQHSLYDVVVIAVAGIDGDGAAIGLAKHGERIVL